MRPKEIEGMAIQISTMPKRRLLEKFKNFDRNLGINLPNKSSLKRMRVGRLRHIVLAALIIEIGKKSF